jgi:hypothetical protein
MTCQITHWRESSYGLPQRSPLKIYSRSSGLQLSRHSFCIAVLFLLIQGLKRRQKGNERLIIRILTCALKGYHTIGELRTYS